MKKIQTLALFALLGATSCSKKNAVNDVNIAPATSVTALPATGTATTAGRPGAPLIKGNWRKVLYGGGIMGAHPTPVTSLVRLQLHADYTTRTLYGTTSGYIGTYALSTAPSYYGPGTMNLITFHFTPSIFDHVYVYSMWADSMSLAPYNAFDGMYEIYVKE